MSDFVAVTDDDLARARTDPAFRHKMLADHLEQILAMLNRLRAASSNPDRKLAAQIREGAQLAVRLSNMLHAGGNKPHAA
jgi:hypothetical protein